MSGRPRCVPVVMYHSVRERRSQTWEYRHLTLEMPFFERQLQYFRRHGYSVVRLEDVVAFKRGDIDLPRRSVCLTFDDGYLDNWVYAFPLLAKHGYPSTLFVATDFVDRRPMLRPRRGDGRRDGELHEAYEVDGFMSWEELREVEAGGLVDVQSHTVTHTFLPASEDIVDFHHPGDDRPWPSWNARPDGKPFYMSDAAAGDSSCLGAPVYSVQPALATREVIERGGLTDHLIALVQSRGGSTFFEASDWLDELVEATARYLNTHTVTYEREADELYERRIRAELVDSKAKIETELGKTVRYLCWPNGGCDDVTHEMALGAGYEATTAKGSANAHASADPTRIQRTGLHQVGSRRVVSSVFVRYALNAHAEVWPYAQVRRALARTRILGYVKAAAYR